MALRESMILTNSSNSPNGLSISEPDVVLGGSADGKILRHGILKRWTLCGEIQHDLTMLPSREKVDQPHGTGAPLIPLLVSHPCSSWALRSLSQLHPRIHLSTI